MLRNTNVLHEQKETSIHSLRIIYPDRAANAGDNMNEVTKKK